MSQEIPVTSPAPSLAGKVILVTGANTGIGKETTRGLAALGATVVLGCRDADKGEAARADIAATTGRSDVAVMALDLADTASIRDFAGRFGERYQRLDVLCNNAGVSSRHRRTTRDGFELTFGVNHLGTFLLTDELLELLKRSTPSRVVVVSSRLYSRGTMVWDDLMYERRSYGPLSAYSQSKLANVLFTCALAERLEGTGVTVNALHPGLVRSELLRDAPGFLRGLFYTLRGALTPVEGAACSVHVASAPELAEVTGAYFVKSRQVPVAAVASDRAAQQRLWDISEKLLGTTD